MCCTRIFNTRVTGEVYGLRDFTCSVFIIYIIMYSLFILYRGDVAGGAAYRMMALLPERM